MFPKIMFSGAWVILILLLCGASPPVCTGSDQDATQSFHNRFYIAGYHAFGSRNGKGKHRYRGRETNRKELPALKNNCGECHLAYQAKLLPQASWIKLFKNLEDHFGESIVLEDEKKSELLSFLVQNAAENSRTKCSTRIMQSMKSGNVPVRITQIPYIIRRHNKISPNTFDRESIGSFSNCSACHTTADRGIYDDAFVKIPE